MVLTLSIDFFTEYKDSETFQVIRDIKKIAFHFVIKGTFLLDFLSLFPFRYVFPGAGT